MRWQGWGLPAETPMHEARLLVLAQGVSPAHIVRAALEAIAYRTPNVLEAMQQDAGLPIPEMRIDGGAAANNLRLQLQADILGILVVLARGVATTARGAAYLAGLATGTSGSPVDIATAMPRGGAVYPRHVTGATRRALWRLVLSSRTWQRLGIP